MKFPPALRAWARGSVPLAPLLSHRLARPVLAGAVVLALGLLGASVVALLRQDAQFEAQRTALALAAAVPEAAPLAAPADEGDFARRLPALPAERLLLEVLHQAAAEAKVAVAEVHFGDRRAATAAALGRSSATVALHGPYAGLKSVLAGVLARVDGASVQRLSLRRAAGNGAGALPLPGLGQGLGVEGLEATWTLSLWSRPRLPEAAASAPAPSEP